MENKKKIIFGFAGRKRSGKGVLADFIVEKYGGKKITIASYLKKLCADLLGMSVEEMNEKKDNGTVLDIPFKEEWCQRIADATGVGLDQIKEVCDGVVIKDVRHMLQFVGTDVIRRFVSSWHIDQAVKEIQQTDNEVFAIDDVRFPDELKAIREIGGIVFFIIRPSQKDVSNHASEISIGVFDFLMPGNILVNTAPTADDFVKEFDEFAEYCVSWVRSNDSVPDPGLSVPMDVFDKCMWARRCLYEHSFSEVTKKRMGIWSDVFGYAIDALIATADNPENPDPLIADIASQMPANWNGDEIWYQYPKENAIKAEKFAVERLGECVDCGDFNRCIIKHPIYIELFKRLIK